MKAVVITILDNEKSQEAADRCIKSAANFGIDVDKLEAITPKDNPVSIANQLEIPLGGFKEAYSRFENCLSAFLSHRSAWKLCYESNKPLIIFEHDALVVDQIPVNVPFESLMSLGKPSYGNFETGRLLGVNLLFSKPYLPGAHAYMLKPHAAEKLLRSSMTGRARPTDIFLNNTYFPWIQEYYPWPVEARDTFTTIQNEEGCIAKHNFNSIYEIL